MFRSNLNTSDALAECKKLRVGSDEAKHLLRFLNAESKRGVTKKQVEKTPLDS